MKIIEKLQNDLQGEPRQLFDLLLSKEGRFVPLREIVKELYNENVDWDITKYEERLKRSIRNIVEVLRKNKLDKLIELRFSRSFLNKNIYIPEVHYDIFGSIMVYVHPRLRR